jgi:hypothetical protein
MLVYMMVHIMAHKRALTWAEAKGSRMESIVASMRVPLIDNKKAALKGKYSVSTTARWMD